LRSTSFYIAAFICCQLCMRRPLSAAGTASRLTSLPRMTARHNWNTKEI
jgi:hypothetical protein